MSFCGAVVLNMPYSNTSSHIPAGHITAVRHVTIPGCRTEWHEHDEYMFLLPKLGSLALHTESNEREQRLAPCVLAVLEPGILHKTKSDGVDHRHTAIYAEGGFVSFCERKAQGHIARSAKRPRSASFRVSVPTSSLIRA
ncbi:hypothetical protein [Paraburkholderia sp. J63]|uniref:hypothetical protein n=1 Tax=Paraburkholderia sp. J63 TaxID=2805434 RepID=UPI002ABDC518|nr:hypothetical protein [Paraburkholderia sp. J63]